MMNIKHVQGHKDINVELGKRFKLVYESYKSVFTWPKTSPINGPETDWLFACSGEREPTLAPSSFLLIST